MTGTPRPSELAQAQMTAETLLRRRQITEAELAFQEAILWADTQGDKDPEATP